MSKNRYFDGPVKSEDSRRSESTIYNHIEDLLADDEEKLVEHIWSQINEFLATYQAKKYNRWAP